jgi:hypothetical protein
MHFNLPLIAVDVVQQHHMQHGAGGAVLSIHIHISCALTEGTGGLEILFECSGHGGVWMHKLVQTWVYPFTSSFYYFFLV